MRSVSTDTSDTSPDWHALRAVPLLAGLPEERLRLLWSESLPRRARTGEVLRAAGTPATHLLLLLRGRVTATASTEAGRRVCYGDWTGPCALDKVAVIDGAGHTATLIADVPCTLRSLRRESFLALVDDVPAVRRHVLRILADQARRGQERWTKAVALPTEARVAAWILEQIAAGPHERAVLPGGQEQLADRLGVTRVTVSRALSRLRRDGLIAMDRRTIRVLAPELLELRARNATTD
jgi:CRP/FNR family transcriptional regulator